MRVVMPEGPNTTNLHCDADYHHPPAEVIIIILTITIIIFIINLNIIQVNWWFPFTPVSGSNSLFVESRPGAGDFKPVQLQYGQVIILKENGIKDAILVDTYKFIFHITSKVQINSISPGVACTIPYHSISPGVEVLWQPLPALQCPKHNSHQVSCHIRLKTSPFSLNPSRVSCDVRVLSLPHHSYDWKDR